RSVLRTAGRLALAVHPCGGNLLSTDGLLGDPPGSGRPGDGRMADAQPWGGEYPHLGVLPEPAARPAAAALLFCQARRNPAAGGDAIERDLAGRHCRAIDVCLMVAHPLTGTLSF